MGAPKLYTGCSVEGCTSQGRISKYFKNGVQGTRTTFPHGYCVMHYQRIKRTGSIEKRDFSPVPCKVEGCPRPTNSARPDSVCKFHRDRIRATGEAGAADVKPPPATHCSVEGCDGRGSVQKPDCFVKGLCWTHYCRLQATGQLQSVQRTKVLCSVNGCTETAYAKTLCGKHYQRVRNNGSLVPVSPIRAERDAAIPKGTRQCLRCGPQPIANFAPKYLGGSSLSSYCRSCGALNQREYRKVNAGKVFFQELRIKFNITEDQYGEMLINQSGLCRICEAPLVSPCIDHDRACCSGDKSCGKCVRGLLCTHCNRGLGAFEDRPERLDAAKAYLTHAP